MHRLRTTKPASRVQGSNDLAGLRGGTCEPAAASRPLRRVRREGGQGQHHLPDHGRSQSLQRRCARRRSDGSCALPCQRVVVLLGDEVVADHPRNFQRERIIYDPWHYLPVLMRKPGALRNGAPFKDWDLPAALIQVRAKLKPHADGDRQFVKILGAVLDHGLPAVEAACAEALEAGIASGDVILTVLARGRKPAPTPSIITPDALRLKIEPAADCGRYDRIRSIA